MNDEGGKGPLAEVRRAAIGLLVAFGIVGLVAGGVLYLFPILSGTTGSEWSVAKKGRISLYYLERDLADLDPQSFLSRVDQAKENILSELNMPESELPARIR